MKNIQFNPVKCLFVNPCKQLQTNGNSIFVNSLNLSSPVEPKYCKECTHIFEDTDLLNMDYNPNAAEDPTSGDKAAAFNESNNTNEYGKTA